MATGGPVKELCEEATCSLCLDYFNDPVMIVECGHNFCRGCLAQWWGESEAKASCPQCRGTAQSRNLRPNRQLANVAEIAKKLSTQERKSGEAMKEEAKERICEKHREPLKLFCQTDQVLLCLVCDRSKEHKTHKVIPAEEASQEYKVDIFRRLAILMTQREKILAYLAEVKNDSWEMLKTAESEREKTVAEFRKLRELLQEQENRRLAQVKEVEKEIIRKRDEHLARLTQELSSLESLIQEMEEKHQQPVMELLQDLRRTLQRCEQKEHFENPVAFPPALKRKLQERCTLSPFLGGIMKPFQDTLVSVLRMEKANVTLDPATADGKFSLSEDRRSIKCQRDPQNYMCGFVLGCEEFTGGCHFWDVSVGSEDSWAVGVARKPLRWRFVLLKLTKIDSGISRFCIHPESGVWAVGRDNGKYKAFFIRDIEDTNPSLSLSGELKRIRVCLDCEGCRVAFFNADAGTLLYTFSGAPFSGQTLRPFFAVWDKGHLRLSSLDS